MQAAKIRKMISEGVLNFAKADKEGRGDPLKLLTKKQIEKNTIWGDSFDFIEKGKDKILSKKLENLNLGSNKLKQNAPYKLTNKIREHLRSFDKKGVSTLSDSDELLRNKILKKLNNIKSLKIKKTKFFNKRFI